MKYLLSLAAVILLASCEKCYQCTTSVTYTPSSVGGNAVSHHEFCGTKKEKENHEKEGTSTTTASSGGVTVTQRSVTGCN